MVQKQFRKIKDWDEWVTLWERNDIEEIALGLLHAGPNIPFTDVWFKEFLERNRAYFEIAKTYPDTIIGMKAYGVLVQRFLWDLVRGASDVSFKLLGLRAKAQATSLLEKTLDFLAEKTAEQSYTKEPYRSRIREFIKKLRDIYLRPDIYKLEILEVLPQEERATKAVVKILENLKEFQLLEDYGFLKVTLS